MHECFNFLDETLLLFKVPCVNAFFFLRVCVDLFLLLCFCSVSVCGQAIHQSVDSTARRITFPLPARIPPILSFYLAPHSVPPDAPPYPASSPSPTQSAIVAIIITGFCRWAAMSRAYTVDVRVPLPRVHVQTPFDLLLVKGFTHVLQTKMIK